MMYLPKNMFTGISFFWSALQAMGFSIRFVRFGSGMSGIVIGKKTNGTGRDGTGLNGIERDGVKL